jgi:hypothetical protein
MLVVEQGGEGSSYLEVVERLFERLAVEQEGKRRDKFVPGSCRAAV